LHFPAKNGLVIKTTSFYIKVIASIYNMFYILINYFLTAANHKGTLKTAVLKEKNT